MDIVNDINELSPVKGENIRCDIFGTGNFWDFCLLRTTRRFFWARRIEPDGVQITFKCGFGLNPERHEFWRTPILGFLEYRRLRKED